MDKPGSKIADFLFASAAPLAALRYAFDYFSRFYTLGAMKQLALDIGLPTGPSLASFYAGRNAAVVQHLRDWVASSCPPSSTLVPTYVWGESGAGKTHLLQAVRQTLREQGVQLGWMDASTGFPPEFDERWTAVLMDDVHLYTPMQQQRAFNWFVNAANPPTGQACWLVAAGNSAPASLHLREDLRSRLGWGYVFEMYVPNEDESREIVRHEASIRGLALSADVPDYMLKYFSRDLSSLLLLLDKLDDFALRNKRAITIPLLKSMLETE